ncbi:MAG: iron(III) transport system permease protein, partial [Glaciecola sp.]
MSVPSLVIALALALPLLWLIIRATQGGVEGLSVAWEPATIALLRTTFLLVFAVTASTALIGTSFAFLTTRTDLPFRRILVVVTALPLVLPTFVGAYTLVAALAPGGLVEEVLIGLGVENPSVPSPYGFRGAWLALTLFTYPYVLLTVRSALRGLDPALEEASLTLGHSQWATFRRVTLPQLRPSIAAGSLLVALYVLSDFGAVSLLRTSTFTRAIYLQYQAAFDRTPAAVLGLQLVIFTIAVLIVEAKVGGDRFGRLRAVRANVQR